MRSDRRIFNKRDSVFILKKKSEEMSSNFMRSWEVIIIASDYDCQ